MIKSKNKPRNPRIWKTYDPNYEPWLTMEEAQSFFVSSTDKIQNRSSKGEKLQ